MVCVNARTTPSALPSMVHASALLVLQGSIVEKLALPTDLEKIVPKNAIVCNSLTLFQVLKRYSWCF